MAIAKVLYLHACTAVKILDHCSPSKGNSSSSSSSRTTLHLGTSSTSVKAEVMPQLFPGALVVGMLGFFDLASKREGTEVSVPLEMVLAGRC